MKEQLEIVIEELKRLRENGHDSVYVSDQALSQLQNLTVKRRKDQTLQKTQAEGRSEPRKRSESRAEKNVEEKPTERKKEALSLPTPPHLEFPGGDKQTRWNWLQTRVLDCEVCKAHVRPGKKIVFGIGNLNADIFFCGEAPGMEEEIQGEPFVGRAGQLLTKIIAGMGLQRNDVYIGNIMNWRPEMPNMSFGNRPPTYEEMKFCLPYLMGQIEIIQPKVIVALGSTAVSGLLGPDPKRRMGDVRGNWFSFQGIPLLITYHPSYLLRNNSNTSKRLVWEDMLKVMEKTELPISEKQRNYFMTPPIE